MKQESPAHGAAMLRISLRIVHESHQWGFAAAVHQSYHPLLTQYCAWWGPTDLKLRSQTGSTSRCQGCGYYRQHGSGLWPIPGASQSCGTCVLRLNQRSCVPDFGNQRVPYGVISPAHMTYWRSWSRQWPVKAKSQWMRLLTLHFFKTTHLDGVLPTLHGPLWLGRQLGWRTSSGCPKFSGGLKSATDFNGMNPCPS
jgi:hypothetical protein